MQMKSSQQCQPQPTTRSVFDMRLARRSAITKLSGRTFAKLIPVEPGDRLVACLAFEPMGPPPN